MALLADDYRPKTWNEVIGQDKALARIKALRPRGLAGRAYWITGASGTGKTTIARLLAAEIADRHDIVEADATALTGADVRRLEHDMQYLGWGPAGGRAYIINEAHGLRKDAIRQFLVTLERLPRHVVVIFTTTCEGEALFEDYDDAGPLLSRCVRIPLARRNLAEAFARRAQEIAQAEGLDGAPLPEYIKLARRCQNNMRAMLQEIEAGVMLA